MYEKIEELFSRPQPRQGPVGQDVPGWWVEMLPVLTCASQADTCGWRIWHLSSRGLVANRKIIPVRGG